MTDRAIDFTDSLTRLDQFLKANQNLWRPQPFKERRPAWCADAPVLCEALLDLPDHELGCYAQDDQALLDFLQGYLPVLRQLHDWQTVSQFVHHPVADPGPHFLWEIPGRKWQQITSFAAALDQVKHPLLEWCGGKGHLGRLLARQWRVPITTVDKDEHLCHAGESLAQRAHIDQEFVATDVLTESHVTMMTQKHIVALHACGELHRALLRQAVAAQVPAIDLAPCCYYFGAAEHYQPFSDGLQLHLTRDDLRLAVTETVTASPRQIEWRDQEMAWKLGVDQLRRDCSGDDRYHPIKPIDKAWLRQSFEEFCYCLAQRDQWQLNAKIDFTYYEAHGWQRQREVMRFNLLRQAFRRALEMWLVLDIACFLVGHGYSVRIGQFCLRPITPRNLLISAQWNKQ